MKPIILVIMDGFGIGKDYGNAIKLANTPALDEIFKNNPYCQLCASGTEVGLPSGQMGNSEVGHTNIGAGRIVYQELTRISNSIKDGSFFENAEIKSIMQLVKDSDASLHVYGLLSDGGVHSHISHLFALLKMAKKMGITNVYVHAWLDGRDTAPKSAIKYLNDCENELKKLKIGKIATLSGRYYAMDRDNRWDRISKAYDAMANGIGEIFTAPQQFIEESYAVGTTDEFIAPAVSVDYQGMSEKDTIICFNFRPDRAREITKSFVENNDMLQVTSKKNIKNYLCFTQYDENIKSVKIAFKPQILKNTFGEQISNFGLKQLRIAETEKYAHVTFFFSGGREAPFLGEDRILIPSPKVATYDLQPEMSAHEITNKAIASAKEKNYDAIILNYANCDMVGHTGSIEATVKATQTVDTCVQKLVTEFSKLGYAIIVTADHGNAEKMLTSDGAPFTAHTSNPVPFCVVNHPCKLKARGKLADIAPTMLKIMGIPQPPEMAGTSLMI